MLLMDETSKLMILNRTPAHEWLRKLQHGPTGYHCIMSAYGPIEPHQRLLDRRDFFPFKERIWQVNIWADLPVSKPFLYERKETNKIREHNKDLIIYTSSSSAYMGFQFIGELPDLST